jgi:ligand-binding sensor domain-containing protein/two-component sensor histidine kinase
MGNVLRTGEKSIRYQAKFNYWRLCALVACLLFSSSLYGQSRLHQFWQINIEEGLVNNIVNAITQDQTGYTWIGTSGGLQKFDGMNFVTFNTANSNLPSNHIKGLYCDDANVMWIITPKGVCKYDVVRNDVNPVLTEGNFENAFFFLDAEDRLWISANGKFFNLDLFKATWALATPQWTPIPGECKFVAAHGSANNIWIATESELFSYDNGRQSLSNASLTVALKFALNGDGIKQITALRIDKHNHLLLALTSTSGKPHSFIFDLIEQKWNELKEPGNAPIHEFLTTVEGATWALGENIMQVSSHKWQRVEPAQAEYRSRFQSPNLFKTIYENRDGSLWIGTSNGIFIFTPQAQQFTYYHNPLSTLGTNKTGGDRITNTKIVSISDTLLMLAKTNSLPIIVNSNFQPVTSFKNLLTPLDVLSSIHKDNKGVIWASTDKKLFGIHFKEKQLTSYALPKGITVAQITSDKNTEDLWIAGADGRVMKFKTDSHRFLEVAQLKEPAEFNSSPVLDLLIENNSSTLWIILEHQIIELETEKGEHRSFKLPRGVRTNQVQEYDKERLLLATDEGLLFFDKKSEIFTPLYYGKEQFNYAVAGVSIDLQKNIWAATKGNGLFRISSSGKEARRFGTNEGVVYSGFGSARNVSLGVNRMAIVTPDGILVFDPLHAPGPLFNPRVQITSFIVNEKEQVNSIQSEPSSLKWNENNVRVGFSSMSYLYNDQTTFSFMLKGYDKDWTKVMQPEIVKYTNLPPGEYTFHVRCMATSGEVISDEATLSFSIVAPFWKTLIFKLAITTSLAIAIFLFYYVRHIRRKNIQEIKNKISRDLHDHIGSSLSSISLMLNVAETKMHSNPNQSSALLKKIENTAQLTQENLHDIVWSIQNEKNSMTDIVDRMEEFYVSLFEGQPARIEFEVDPAVRDLNLDLQKRYNLYLLFKEIVNNGAKYSKATRVSTAIRKQANTITLSYDDNGIGFCTDPAPEGNGLANMKQRAALLGGTIDIQSRPGHGTQIELTFSK